MFSAFVLVFKKEKKKNKKKVLVRVIASPRISPLKARSQFVYFFEMLNFCFSKALETYKVSSSWYILSVFFQFTLVPIAGFLNHLFFFSNTGRKIYFLAQRKFFKIPNLKRDMLAFVTVVIFLFYFILFLFFFFFLLPEWQIVLVSPFRNYVNCTQNLCSRFLLFLNSGNNGDNN